MSAACKIREINIFKKMKKDVISFCQTAKDLGEDDPRRIIHSLKVGLAITLVSLFYYFEPLYEGFGVSAMWAVLTVVVVFEYSVGATLGKGVNRAVGTSLAAMLAVGVHRLATLSGDKTLPYFLAVFVFFIAAGVTFLRFFPRLKARYDYGLLIFILTLALISVSGYREEEVLEMAHKRISTILIGSSAALATCVFIYPVWAGTDLHNLVADNIEKLGNFLEEFGAEYFRSSSSEKDEEINDEKRRYMEGYKTVLDSINNLDSLVKLARWEPRHGWFRYRHPWAQYRIIGVITRNCACRIEALNGYLHSADIQAPPEVKTKIEDSCTQLSTELGATLKELALSIKTMTHPSSTSSKSHLQNSKSASEKLNSTLKTNPWKDITDATSIIPAATVASLLNDILVCTNDIDVAVQELASLARFKKKKKNKAPYHKEHDDKISNTDKSGSCSSSDDRKECKGKPNLSQKQVSKLRKSLAKGQQYHAVVTIKEEEEEEEKVRNVKESLSRKFSTRYKDPASLDMPPHDGE